MIKTATPRGIANWHDLDREQQFEALAWIVDRIERTESCSEISPDAERVGFGFRQRDGGSSKRPRLYKTPVLVVHVRRKWSQDPKRGADARRVPEWIQLRVSVGDRSVQLAVPTDVYAETRPPRAHGDGRSLLIRKADLSDRGSACALVKDHNKDDGPRYMLTCHHVAFSTLVTKDSQASPRPTISDSDDETILGNSTRPAKRFGPGVVGSVDAALVRLQPAGEEVAATRAFWKIHPEAWPKTKGQLAILATANKVRLLSKWGPARFEFVEHVFNQDVMYHDGNVVSIAQVVKFRSASGSRAPRGGDSGGAMIAGDKILLGMHIAGDSNTGESYVIPAYLLFHCSVFRPRIDIATGVVS